MPLGARVDSLRSLQEKWAPFLGRLSQARRQFVVGRVHSDILRPLAIALMFGIVSYLAYLAPNDDVFAHDFTRMLYFVPIIATAYSYGPEIALFASLGATSLFFPQLVIYLSAKGLSASSLALGGLLISYNVLAVLVSSRFELDRQRRRFLDATDRLGKIWRKSLDPAGLLPSILQQSIWLCNAEGGEIFLLQEQGSPLAIGAGQRILKSPSHQPAVPDAYALPDWLLERNQLTMLPDLGHDPRFEIPQGMLLHRVTLVSVPLRRKQKQIGLLTLWHLGSRRFSEQDADLLRVLADESQTLMENAWLHTQTDQNLSRQTRQLMTLLDVSSALSSTRDLDRLLAILCQRMVESVETTLCRVALLEQDGQSLALRASFAARPLGWDPGVGCSFPISLLQWNQQVMEKVKPVVLFRDRPELQIWEPERSLLFGDGAKSVLLMPLAIKGHSLGMAMLGEARSWERAPFTPTKIELCRAIAGQAALAIENARALDASVYQSQRMKLLLDNIADGVFRTDPEGRVLTFNPAAERITGYSSLRVIGRRCRDVFAGTSADGSPLCGTQCPLDQITDSTRSTEPVQCKEWITGREGKKVPIHHSVAPFIDLDGCPRGAVSVIRDVSQEEELARLQSEFTSLVSHELRAPLTTMQVSAELLATSSLEDAEAKDMLETLNRECARLGRLVDEMLQASRLESGQVQLVLEPLALTPLMEQTVSAYQARYNDYHFEVQPASKALFVLGDLISVRVVLENLLQNAVNYSPAGSTITVASADQGKLAAVRVQDQGAGIPADQLSRIFERYHRLAERHKASGFGLGLYIARMLVELQGGRIWAESVPGQGACFHFTLKQLGDADEKEDSGHR